MSFWVLLQVFTSLVLFAAVGFIWVRLNRPAKDDPRLSRGLQLLQSKISVLEDLSDRTDTQVTQLTALIEQKGRDIQNLIFQSEKQLQKIEASMGKSMEVAKIFQDKIPHQEIIERQNTVKYVKAAKMAHAGASVDEIAGQVDLSRGEIEFIAKINRDQLQFSEEALPQWAMEIDTQSDTGASVAPQAEEPKEDLQTLMHSVLSRQKASLNEREEVAEPIRPASVKESPKRALADLGNQFRQGLKNPSELVQKPAPRVIQQQQQVRRSSIQSDVVKKVVFPKIEVNGNLG
ncbi:MAG: DUF2802 domain-containing protein [Bdellovibrio sp. CG10_big_fil_rev_8_21_14_0_10_47_8]|nr:MAG: DUF2802 domain-containing protein [Bdellovibrio sp. CG10_big_fil_rev_8_21_14_0_10_47_8]